MSLNQRLKNKVGIIYVKVGLFIFFFLTGDELYPEDPDYTGETKIVMATDKKVEDLMKEGSTFHRIVIKNINSLAVYVNIQAKYKHMNPLMINTDYSDYNSRL